MFDPPAKSGLGCCCRERLRVDSAELTTPTVFVASPHGRCHYGDGRDWIRRWPMMELTCPGPDSKTKLKCLSSKCFCPTFALGYSHSYSQDSIGSALLRALAQLVVARRRDVAFGVRYCGDVALRFGPVVRRPVSTREGQRLCDPACTIQDLTLGSRGRRSLETSRYTPLRCLRTSFALLKRRGITSRRTTAIAFGDKPELPRCRRLLAASLAPIRLVRRLLGVLSDAQYALLLAHGARAVAAAAAASVLTLTSWNKSSSMTIA